MHGNCGNCGTLNCLCCPQSKVFSTGFLEHGRPFFLTLDKREQLETPKVLGCAFLNGLGLPKTWRLHQFVQHSPWQAWSLWGTVATRHLGLSYRARASVRCIAASVLASFPWDRVTIRAVIFEDFSVDLHKRLGARSIHMVVFQFVWIKSLSFWCLTWIPGQEQESPQTQNPKVSQYLVCLVAEVHYDLMGRSHPAARVISLEHSAVSLPPWSLISIDY